MSLNESQRRATADELARNLFLSGLSPHELAVRIGLPVERVAAALELRDADPIDVWQVRDVLETAVRDAGRQPVAYSVLTDDARRAARGWFGVGDHR